MNKFWNWWTFYISCQNFIALWVGQQEEHLAYKKFTVSTPDQFNKKQEFVKLLSGVCADW